MPKEIYEWFIQHPDVRVETYYDEIFKKLCVHMVLGHFHNKYIITDFDHIEDVNELLLVFDHMYKEIIEYKEYIT